MSSDSIASLLETALQARAALFDARHESAFRLFNGFSEGDARLVVDVYAATLVIYNYADDPSQGEPHVQQAAEYLLSKLSWLRAGVVKTRNAKTPEGKRGQIVFGEKPDARISEHGLWYAIDLVMNRDASFYLDTRNLRRWLMENLQGKTILNTFAYTGSLGIAALAGGARRVVQHDLNRRFLNIAKMSCALNSLPIREPDFVAEDFFSLVGRLKRAQEIFDGVIIDPPFFSITSRGRVDQVHESARLINKVRPLVRDGGILISINNALYVSGKDYMRTLEALCEDGYLEIRELISVPKDVTGYSRITPPVTDPAPFDHSTKIAVLGVRRKS